MDARRVLHFSTFVVAAPGELVLIALLCLDGRGGFPRGSKHGRCHIQWFQSDVTQLAPYMPPAIRKAPYATEAPRVEEAQLAPRRSELDAKMRVLLKRRPLIPK